jgi:hypothetical protein
VIVGWTDPEGARPFLGALLLGYYDPDGRLVYAGRAGTGIGHEQVCRRIGSSAEAAAEVFEGWIGTVESLQAWIVRAAWILKFNPYEEFAQRYTRAPWRRIGTAWTARRGCRGYASWPRGCGSTSLSLRLSTLGSSKPSPSSAGTAE